MFSYVQILFLTLAVLAILALSDRGLARAPIDAIPISSGCYTVESQRTCPPEISGYVPVSAGPGDVYFVDPFGNIVGVGQQQQQQQDMIQQEDGKEVAPPQHQQHQHGTTPGLGGTNPPILYGQ